MKTNRSRVAVLAALVAPWALAPAQQRVSFVTTLGKDTLSFEQCDRTQDSVVGDSDSLSPREVEAAADDPLTPASVLESLAADSVAQWTVARNPSVPSSVLVVMLGARDPWVAALVAYPAVVVHGACTGDGQLIVFCMN